MRKGFLALIMLAIYIPAQANILDILKTKAATKYELGVFKLELAAYMLSDKLRGKKMAESGFKIANYRTEKADGKIYFVVSGIGKEEHLSETTCNRYHEKFVSNGILRSLIYKSWPNLSELEYKEIEKNIKPAVELISKENKEHTMMCL